MNSQTVEEFFTWLHANPRQHFFHLWTSMGEFGKIVYTAQYAHIQAKGGDLVEVLATLRSHIAIAFPENT